MLELLARGGMRGGEFLKLRVGDVDDRKLSINSPKSGRQSEVVFIPLKVAERLRDSICFKVMRSSDRIFSMGYTGARAIVNKVAVLQSLISAYMTRDSIQLPVLPWQVSHLRS